MTNSNFKTKEEYLSLRVAWAAHLKHTAEQHLLYNILRGKAHDSGFTPLSNHTKLSNGSYVNNGLQWAMLYLKSIITAAAANIKNRASHKENSNAYQSKRLETFLTVFNGTVTVETLVAIKLPKTVILHPDFGVGKRLANDIIYNGFKPTNLAQIYEHIAAYETEAKP